MPTVSDAACVLGYFDPDFFLGGRMQLDIPAARQAIATVANRIGRSVEETAWNILNLATELMIKAIQEITIAEGVNPRESTIVAGGGAAGINILPIAQELGCERVILPKVASALSASGMQFADIVKEETASLVTTSDRFSIAGVNRTLAALEDKLKKFVTTLGARAEGTHHIEFLTEARYLAQVWELETPLPFSRFRDQADVDGLVESFHKVHERVFAMRDVGSPVECVNWKARLVVKLASEVRPGPTVAVTTAPAPSATRPCYFGGNAAVATPIYKSSDLKPGFKIFGPAIVEEPTTTLVVFPQTSTTVSGAGNYIFGID
jgi:N-methylhydantoinase A